MVAFSHAPARNRLLIAPSDMPILLPFGRDRGDAVDLDIEMPWPGWDVHENPRRRVFREIAEVDRVDSGKLLDRRAIDIAFEDVIRTTILLSPSKASVGRERVRSGARSERR